MCWRQIIFVQFQRRSLAPSQKNKRREVEENSSKRVCSRKPLNEIPTQVFRSRSEHVSMLFVYLSDIFNNICLYYDSKESYKCLLWLFQEEHIKRILARPFQIPIPGYVSTNSGGRSLGIKRNRVRKALYDPFTPNALLLFSPPKVTEHEKLKADA